MYRIVSRTSTGDGCLLIEPRHLRRKAHLKNKNKNNEKSSRKRNKGHRIRETIQVRSLVSVDLEKKKYA